MSLTKTIKLTKHSPHIRKQNRQITQKLKPIENALKKRLLVFYNQKIKGNLTPIELLRPRYEVQINNLIRKTIYDSYFAGTNNVMKQINNKDSFSEISILVKDFDNINRIVEEQGSRFWQTAGRLKWREAEIQKPELQIEAALIGVSAWVTYHSFNKAVVSKMQDVMSLNQPNQNKIAARTKGSRNIKTRISEEFTNFAGRVIFTTMHDAKVCQICMELDGEIYEGEDVSGTPVLPIHNFCRCRLVPLIDIMM